ncbi:alpha/beta hydrolase [Blastopirellula marina]|uniref:Enterochelin esterase n=1 Tax=Blastopirellula marina DSM 3645 TaxID=314230 RepID=A3ZPC2_9BACT|nr:alpha/beta hydrolase-fold protein [Blastopirellula marina]EAQ81600.1 enterochelin esterase [Blastopirellula marina DSM 3645]
MTARSYVVCVTLLLLVGRFCFSAEETNKSPSISVGEKRQGTLQPEETQAIALQATEGDFVRGSISGSGTMLMLIDSKKQLVRCLADGRGPNLPYMFVVGDAGPYELQVTSQTGGDYQLSVDAIVAAKDQVAPARVLASPRLRQLQQTLATGGTTASFWEKLEAEGTPLVEADGVLPPLARDEALVTFLYRGAKRNVRLFGAPSGDHDDLQRLGDTDVWYGSYRVPSAARIDYRLAPDVPELPGSGWERRRAILATAQRDPLNSLAFPADNIDIYAGSSVVELPDSPEAPWLERRSDVTAGKIERHRFESKVLGNTRDIYFYRPADYDPQAAENGLAVFFDGDVYLNEVGIDAILDNLIATGEIRSTAAILISNPSPQSRSNELPCNAKFAQFVAEEVMPWAKSQGLDADRQRTVVAGASYGGLAAAYLGLEHPELFGNVYSQSGSFWWAPNALNASVTKPPAEWLTREYVTSPRHEVKYFLEAGSFEANDRIGSILTTTKHLRDVLEAKGYDVQFREFPGGHGFFYWRYNLPRGLIDVLCPEMTAVIKMK